MTATTTVAAYTAADRRQATARKRLEQAGSPAVFTSVAGGAGAISAVGVLAAGGHLWDALFAGVCGAAAVLMAHLVALVLAEGLFVDRREEAFSRARSALIDTQARVVAIADEFDTVNWEALPDTLRDEAHTALACAVQAADWLAWYRRRPENAGGYDAQTKAAWAAIDGLTAVRDSVRTAVEFAAADPESAPARKAYADWLRSQPALRADAAEAVAVSTELAATATAAFTRR